MCLGTAAVVTFRFLEASATVVGGVGGLDGPAVVVPLSTYLIKPEKKFFHHFPDEISRMIRINCRKIDRRV
jgi:hypothetical protein